MVLIVHLKNKIKGKYVWFSCESAAPPGAFPFWSVFVGTFYLEESGQKGLITQTNHNFKIYIFFYPLLNSELLRVIFYYLNSY